MKLPKNERSKVGYYSSGGELRFILTQKDNGGFTLYRVDSNETIKLGRGTDPKKLEEAFKVLDEIYK